jgi:putative SOS response-associated peptidase YedK
MCSRFTLVTDPDVIRATFGYVNHPNFPPRHNIAPTQPISIVRVGSNGARELALVRWGLIPSWVKDPEDFSTIINARCETAAEKPSFRAAMHHRRCLIPADGFIEWTGQKGSKRPFLIKSQEENVLAFAGLWEHWQGADGSEIESAVILTTEANATVSPLHHRMPVILDPEHFDAWLDCKRLSPRDVQEFLAPAEDDLLEAVEVDPKINNPANDGPEVLEPLQGSLL